MSDRSFRVTVFVTLASGNYETFQTESLTNAEAIRRESQYRNLIMSYMNGLIERGCLSIGNAVIDVRNIQYAQFEIDYVG